MSYSSRDQKTTKSITYKVILSGDGGVGKTTLLHRFVEGKFTIDTMMTIGVGFFLKDVDLGDKNKYSLQLWDFGGEEQFRIFLDAYASGANGAILAFDLTRMKTLENIEQWVNIIRKEDPRVPIIFIGTKSDLKEKISVEDRYALEFVKKYNFAEFIKVSSKTGENVDYVFQSLTKKIIDYMDIKYK